MSIEKLLITCSLCVVICSHGAIHNDSCSAVKPPEEIIKGFENCDARVVGRYFDLSVELIFNESQAVYAKSQAEQILRNFFNNNVSQNRKFIYKHLHGSDRENVKYFIGELNTGKGLYRVTIYMKDHLIYRMRIENND